MEFRFLLTAKGYLRTRESTEVEYKANFNAANILFYLRSLAGMANNKGGQLIFGVRNAPHIPDGLSSNRFQELDPAEINRLLLAYFEPAFEVHQNVLEFDGKQFGQLWVAEATTKPIVCKAANERNKLREAAIYFRYRGETREIHYPELSALLHSEKEKEKKLWMEHIEKISIAGPRNIHLLNASNGELTIGDGKIILDNEVLKTINFIREGKLVEKDGAPAYVLRGVVSGIDYPNAILPSDDLYPLFTRDLCAQLRLNQHEILCILSKLGIKGDKRYHAQHKTSSKTNVHKYAKALVPIIERFLKRGSFLQECLEHYKQANQNKGGRKKRLVAHNK